MFSLEDFYGAGYFARLLWERGGCERFALSDSAIAAMHLSRNNTALDILAASRVGQRMAGRGMQADIRHAATPDGCPIVAALTDGQSEERRGGKECVRTVKLRWSAYH